MRALFLHYVDDVKAGGSLRVGQLLANHLPPQAIEARILFAYGKKGPVGRESRVPVDYGSVGGRLDALGWLRVRRYVRDFAPDILHFQDPLTVCRVFLKGIRGKRITHCHGRPLFPPKTLVERANARWLRGDTDLFVCIDAVAARTLQHWELAKCGGCIVLPNAVDYESLQNRPSRATARELLKLPSEPKLLGMVCRVVENKGFADLFRQMSVLPPEWQVAVFGEGVDRIRLQSEANSLGLKDRVHFMGPIDDVRPVYAAIDCYFFATAHESFGLVLAEAMACRVPVFGFHGLGEYREHNPPLIDETVAVMIERKDVARLRDPINVSQPEDHSLHRILASQIAAFNPSLDPWRKRLDAAQQRVREHFNIRSRARKLTEIYGNLTSM